ncbi:ABC transporter permease [Desulfospira joergensenii]|uniref:ABC transporter permease n=1 Tax=Desulfospira joergensenii TaxID=53329 RepID=UPI0003B2EA23|nr:ABC transporter permease [Desulfospira joergensenii]
MFAYAIRRIIFTIPMLFFVFTIIFFVMRMAGGDPTYAILGDHASEEAIVQLRLKLGLDDPVSVQYMTALKNLIKGDLGNSLINDRPIAPQIMRVLPYTIELTVAAIIIGLVIGIPSGVAAALKRNKPTDYILRVCSLAGLSMPSFYLGILLLLVFAVQLDWFPIIGFTRSDSFLERLHYLFLPALSLGLNKAAFVSRVARSNMLERMGSDYVRTARAKGLSEYMVIFKHALKDCMIPIVTVSGVYVGVLLGGAILTESIFNRPGLGKFLVEAISQRDYNAIQSGLVFYGIVIVLVNLAVDLVYGFIDPRVKYE